MIKSSNQARFSMLTNDDMKEKAMYIINDLTLKDYKDRVSHVVKSQRCHKEYVPRAH